MIYRVVLLSLVVLCVFTGACKKHVHEKMCCVPPPPSPLWGYWELRQVQAGMTPVQNYAEGNGSLLQFTAGNVYNIWLNGQIRKTGRYDFAPDGNGPGPCDSVPGSGWGRLVYDTNFTSPKTHFRLQLSDSLLQTMTGCMAVDGGTFTLYKKVTVR